MYGLSFTKSDDITDTETKVIISGMDIENLEYNDNEYSRYFKKHVPTSHEQHLMIWVETYDKKFAPDKAMNYRCTACLVEQLMQGIRLPQGEFLLQRWRDIEIVVVF